MKLLTINRETELEESKLFGEVYLPNEWLEKDIFSPFEFFLCQINLEQIKCDLLPKTGYLYFFIEAYSLTAKKLKAKVRYFNGEPDAYTDFNEGFFEDDPISWALVNESIGTLNLCDKKDNSIFLLEIPTELLPFEIEYKKMAFSISESDLKNTRFENISLVFIN